MPNPVHDPKVFADEVRRVISACRLARTVRACLLMTRDRDHAVASLKDSAASAGIPLRHFSIAARSRFIQDRNSWVQEGGPSADPVELLRSVRDVRGGGIVVLEDCARFLRDEGGDMQFRMAFNEMVSADNSHEGLLLMFLEPPESESRLPSILSDRFLRLEMPYPRAEELEAIAREEIARTSVPQSSGTLDLVAIKKEAGRLSSGVVGLTRSAARDALRDVLSSPPADFDAAHARLQDRKCSQLRRELAMDVLDTQTVESPIGLSFLVDYLRILQPRMTQTGQNRARGVLLIGPPGTGKTMLARSIGALVGLPVVAFRIAALMNSLLGETERRFSQAFSTLEAMSPNVVFIDEIEKAFGDSGERDGGTMMRCTGSLLTWLSDNPYGNFIVATSNSLSRMGEIGLTMTRSERFDAAFFVDVPALAAREEMLRRWLAPLVADSSSAAHELAEVTDRFSGADLHSIVKHATARAEYDGGRLSMDLLIREADKKRPRTLALYDSFAPLREWGRLNCDPAGPVDQ